MKTTTATIEIGTNKESLEYIKKHFDRTENQFKVYAKIAKALLLSDRPADSNSVEPKIYYTSFKKHGKTCSICFTEDGSIVVKMVMPISIVQRIKAFFINLFNKPQFQESK